jgi:hypothetical protein
MKKRVEAAINRAASIAARYGVASAPSHEADQLLWNKFDGDILKIQETIAYYDEHDDEIVFNRAHPARGDMRGFVRSLAKQHFYSTASRDHVIRHEIGHCLHYRRMTDTQRAEIWCRALSPEEKLVAAEVSGYATEGRVEFIAEVYAQLWARRKCEAVVMSLYVGLRRPFR